MVDVASGQITTDRELDRDYVAEVTFEVLANDTRAEKPKPQTSTGGQVLFCAIGLGIWWFLCIKGPMFKENLRIGWMDYW